MTPRVALGAAVAAVVMLQVHAAANLPPAGAPAPARVDGERYHYSMSARIRPLLVFWVSRSGVGEAVVTRRRAPGDIAYSLLIGSDPDRAPRRINRWGYIEEEIRGADARLMGLMTESDEESIEQAEANLRRQAAGRHPFKVIQATVTAEQATSVVTSMFAPEDYTLRQLHSVLDFVRGDADPGRTRVVRLPAGTRPGFLSAVADAMHAPAGPIGYVYHGKLYTLRQTRLQRIANVNVGQASYGRGVAADFEITSLHDGEQTRFSMTYGTDGRFADVPLIVTYQPRWWMQVELTLDDQAAVRGVANGEDR
jgi:hypothetical protein